MTLPPLIGRRLGVCLTLFLALAMAGCNPPPEVPAAPTSTAPVAPALTAPATPIRPAQTPFATLPARPTVQIFFPDLGRSDPVPTARSTQVALVPAPQMTPIPTIRPPQTAAPTPTTGPTATPRPTNTPGPTRTPRPTPTPKFPPAIAEPGASKLGIHVIHNNSPDIMEFVRVAKPRIMKGVDDLYWLREVKQASPQTVTVGRVTASSQRYEGDPAPAARSFVAEQLEKYNYNREGVDYWEGWNEPAPKTAEEMAWYAAFEAERVRALAEHGLRAAVGTYPTGVPEWDIFALFLPAIQAAKQHNGALALHEYSAPTMQFGVGAGLPGRPPAANRGVLTLRYRYWYEDFLKPRGLVIPLLITEAGVDGGIRNRPGPGDSFGWRDFHTYWVQQGFGDNHVQTYLDQLQWYDNETRQDSYVVGFTVFTVGNPDRDQWGSFDVTDILPAIARYMVTQ